MNNSYKRYCSKCFFTVYPTEGIRNKENKVVHPDCKEALADKTIVRHLNPKMANLYGTAKRKKLVKLLEEYPV